MAEQSSKSHFTGEEVLALLDEEEEDSMDDNFFPGSNEDFALNSEEDSDAEDGEEVIDAGEDDEDSDAEEEKYKTALNTFMKSA